MKIGKILVHTDLILNHPGMVHKITEGMVIVRAEQLFEHNAVEYVAIGEMFDEINEGETAPTYHMMEDDGVMKYERNE